MQTLTVSVKTEGRPELDSLAGGFDRVGSEAKRAARSVKLFTEHLRDLGRASASSPLQKAMIDGIAKPTSVAEKNMKSFREQGLAPVGAMLASVRQEVEGSTGSLATLGDKAQVAAMGMRDLNQDGLGNLVDMLQIVELGPFGAGLTAVAAGAGAAAVQFNIVSAGLGVMIDRSVELQERQAQLSRHTDDATVAYAELALGHADVGEAMLGLDTIVSGASFWLNVVPGRARKAAAELTGNSKAVDLLIQGVTGGLIPLSAAAGALENLGEAAGVVRPRLSSIATGFSSLTGPIGAASAAVGRFVDQLARASDAWANSVLSGGSALGGRFGKTGQAAVRTAFGAFGIDSSEQREAGVAKAEAAGRRAMRTAQGTGGRGGGGGGGLSLEGYKTDAGMAAEDRGRRIAAFQAAESKRALDRYRGDGAGFEGGFGFLQKAAEDASAFSRELAKATEAKKKFNEAGGNAAVQTGIMLGDLSKMTNGALKTGFQDLTSSVGQFFGAFAAGTSTLGAFGDAMLDLFGNLSSTIGNFFIQTGTGMLFVPGAQAQGAGLIAAGIGLNALGGLLGGKGSGNRGSGSSSGSAGALVGSQTGPVLPRDRGGPSTFVIPVTIGGERLATVYAQMDNHARRGGFQHIAVR